jgi:hypothetical protein
MAGARRTDVPMTRIGLVGLGEVGTRAGRQLVDTPEVHELVLMGRDVPNATSLAGSFGPKATVGAEAGFDALDALVVAVPEGEIRATVERAVDAGVPTAVVATSAGATRTLLEFHDAAVQRGVCVIAGAGLAPGLSDVLVRHAADLFDEVDEIKIAATGWAGPACLDAVVQTRREPVRRRRDGRPDPVSKPFGELVWFPDPIGARDCELVTSSLEVLERIGAPAAPAVSIFRGDEVGRRRLGLRSNRRFGADGQWGAARCEVWGRRNGAVDVVVYGVVERTAVAAGTVAAVAGIGLATGTGLRERPAGVHGLGALVDPLVILADLADRGIRVATFEGAPLA